LPTSGNGLGTAYFWRLASQLRDNEFINGNESENFRPASGAQLLQRIKHSLNMLAKAKPYP